MLKDAPTAVPDSRDPSPGERHAGEAPRWRARLRPLTDGVARWRAERFSARLSRVQPPLQGGSSRVPAVRGALQTVAGWVRAASPWKSAEDQARVVAGTAPITDQARSPGSRPSHGSDQRSAGRGAAPQPSPRRGRVVLRWLMRPLARAIAWAQRQSLMTVYLPRAAHWLRDTSLWRFFTKSLLRRILISNLIGLIVLLGGVGLFSRQQQWLVDAKVESLSAQARMVAVAIAANAKVDRDSITLDPERLPEVDGSRVPFRDDGFAALELSIAPERVAPILRRLIQTGGIRARVYDRNGTLIVDSAPIFNRGGAPRLGETSQQPSNSDRARVRNAWTRTWAWLFGGELPVYREIGPANGTSYPEVRDALAGQMTRMLLLSDAGEQIVTVAAPIQQRRNIQGVVLLSSLPGEIDRLLTKERTAYWTLAALALLAGVITSLLLARTIAGPMQKLSNAADSVSVSVTARHELPDLSGRQDEIGRMAQSFNGMTANLLRRIEASDRFAQDVAHELKNPVAAARSTAEALAYAKTDERREHLVRQMKGELVRLNRLISDVANASRLDAELALQETELLDFKVIIGNVVGVLKDIHSESGVSISFAVEASADGPDLSVVRGHEGRLSQVMTNLIDNALSFSPRGTTVRVALARSGPAVVATIDDDGPGIPANKLDDVFKRFYSDRPQSDQKTGKNSGLGLSISREIVEAHGGRVWAENRALVPGQLPPPAESERSGLAERRLAGVAGARFSVELPWASSDSKKR